jgi:hypothetical protein
MKSSHSSVSAPLGKDWYQNGEAPARVWGPTVKLMWVH